MRISSFSIGNYKSFEKPQRLQLSSGFNIIVGQNNVGKSALLEALALRFTSKPHKSKLTIPERGMYVNPMSSADVTFKITGQELKLILRNQIRGFYVVTPADPIDFNQLFEKIFLQDEINLRFIAETNNANPPIWTPSQLPSGDLYSAAAQSGDNWNFISVGLIDDKFVSTGNIHSGDRRTEFGIHVADILRSRIYRFDAERLNLGSSRFGPNRILASNAANLPEALSALQGDNLPRFNRLNQLVRQIFPTIYQVSAVNRPSDSVEIVVWIEDPRTERDDLTIPLSESGTGVGQVLAILYVVLTSDFPTTIIIDEPNSFLHPSAARKLIEILRKDFSQHQYIVSTHSAEIIRTANPDTLTLIRWEKPQSVVEQLDATKIHEAQKCLIEIGARLSDVFGADKILWVEGQTEEECYRLILGSIVKAPALGVSIVAVKNTGDFENKRLPASLIWDIYERLSHSNALIPPAIAFVFDREGKTPKEMEDLNRKSGGRVRFLPRSMYENYLICPEALKAIMAHLPTFKETPITRDKIVEWLTDNGGNKAYILDGLERVGISDRIWLANVDGAKLLHVLFTDLSGGKEEYHKTVHSVELTDWLIKNKPEVLDDLVVLLRDILGINT